MRDNERDRPLGGREFFKGHGLGNDYLVVDEGSAWRLTPDAIRGVCHRNLGVGSDGVVLLHRGEAQPFRVRGFNPDGSEFERSGNGLRIVAAHLFRSGRVSSDPFAVEIAGDRVSMQVHGADGRGEYDVSVQMGSAAVGPEAVGYRPAPAEVASEGPQGSAGGEAHPQPPTRHDARLPGAGRLVTEATGALAAEFVSVGNPHCVVFGSPEPWRTLAHDALQRIGPALATHPSFSEGVNVQLARIVATDTIEALVWERGVGHTTASGTSACAVAVAAVASGRLPPGEKVVLMEGGELEVRVDEELGVRLRGPVRAVADGELDPGFCRALSGR